MSPTQAKSRNNRDRSIRFPLILPTLALVLISWPPLPLQAQRGGLVLQQNLAALVDAAETIVRGHVVKAQVEPHPDFRNLYTVRVTLRVQESLKGQSGELFTFRQYIWDLRDRQDAAGYQKGGELLLLMSKPSSYGLSSPVGLEQGRFRIVRDRQGRKSAVNGAGNAALFADLAATLDQKGTRLRADLVESIRQHRQGPVPLALLSDMIRHLVGVP